jgi:hypothetical protein
MPLILLCESITDKFCSESQYKYRFKTWGWKKKTRGKRSKGFKNKAVTARPQPGTCRYAEATASPLDTDEAKREERTIYNPEVELTRGNWSFGEENFTDSASFLSSDNDLYA